MNSNAFHAELEKRISRSIAYPHDLRERMWRSWSENIGKLLNLRCINLVVPSPHPLWYHQQSQLANTTWERSRFLGKDSKKGTTNMFKLFSFMFWDLSRLVVPSSHSLHIPCTWERSHFLCSMGWMTSAVLPTTNTMEHSIGIDLSNPARRLNYSLPNFASMYKTSSLSIDI